MADIKSIEYYDESATPPYAFCTACMFQVTDSCMSCGMSFAQALKEQKERFTKDAQKEQDAVDDFNSKSTSGSTFPNELPADIKATGVTQPLFLAVKNHVFPLEGHADWDTSIMGDDSIALLKILGPIYASLTKKNTILDIMRANADDDQIVADLRDYIAAHPGTP